MATPARRERRGPRFPEPPPWGAVVGHHTIWPTALQADLLRATLLPDERALAAWQRIRPRLDVAAMDYSTHALLPRLRANLISLGVDDELLRLFKGVHRFAWARNQVLLAQVMPVVAALQRAGVPTLLLKGAALLADERQDAGLRQMSDIDVLVPADSVSAAIEVIVDHGLLPPAQLPLWYVADYAPRFTPSIGFTDGAEGHLDLHWHAMHWSCQPGADEAFWAASVPVELRGVRTRALCPTDELLLVMMHGLRWSPGPTYRWVMDAMVIARGSGEAVDYDRLALQARRRRLAPAARAALRYLRWIVDLEVPNRVLRSLRVAAPLQRLELRAQATQPRHRSRVEQAASLHGQFVRRRIAPGERATPAMHLRLAAERLGVQRPAQLRDLRDGPRPGPGRPYSDADAPIGTGACAPPPLRWGVALGFDDDQVVREHCLYGLWRPEEWGCWIAGREARLALELPERPDSSLLLELAAGGMVVDGRPRQRLGVLLDRDRVASLVFDAARPRVDGETILLPAQLVRGRRRLEIVLRAPDAISPARLGAGDDQRTIGVFLRNLAIRTPVRCEPGRRLPLGVGTGDERMLAGGWSRADPHGRWTEGTTARMLLTPTATATAIEWNAHALMPPGAPPLRVEVAANGVALGTLVYDASTPRAPARLALGEAATSGELLVSWRIHDPRSPRAFGLSDDPRQLGLFVRDVTLVSD